uniref:DNA repair and recombination protein RAD54-like n=1 Tax=Syphacia muris TaxID=451379 RepID=A0A0N5AA18_9BILA
MFTNNAAEVEGDITNSNEDDSYCGNNLMLKETETIFKVNHEVRNSSVQDEKMSTVSPDYDDISLLANVGVTAYSASLLESKYIEQAKQANDVSDGNVTNSLNCSDDTVKQSTGELVDECGKKVCRGIMDYIFEPSTSSVNGREDNAAESDSDSKIFTPNLEDEASESSINSYDKVEIKQTKKKKAEKSNKGTNRVRDDAYDSDFEKRIRFSAFIRLLHQIGTCFFGYSFNGKLNRYLKSSFTGVFWTVKASEEASKIEKSFDDSYHELDFGLKVPNICWKKLYKYQKTGVKWLNALHEQCVGGILADEMGLGKTIQVVCFLCALSFTQGSSRGFNFCGLGPVLIICPTTLMHQWLKELRKWFPLCRVAIFHSSGTFRGHDSVLVRKFSKLRRDGSVLITSYTTFTKKYKLLISVDWHYVILDEGHKIRNPNAQTTMAIKDIRTPHRLLLSGSPLQNNLKELWSLIDFIYPGRLGSLQSFTEKFAIPITQGGYANANSVQVRTAYKCACVLRDAICPYLLRRMKKDVEMVIQLPSKTEQVLFCEITSFQRKLYKDYLSSRECGRILAGKMDAFIGLITLRKLCNHPDLLTGGPNKHGDYNITIDEDMDFGAACRSGKMMVLKTLLKLWFEQNQRVLIFSQSRQMLTILEKFVIKENYSYLRMDGTTTIANRQPLVDRFNNEKGIFLFLLTTRVGGLGVNLTGANRVVIFDPDWNPSTDMQARERAWRIGQERSVTIYRLLTNGTIEEKIYQRQIFKQFLANRVLIDPKQRRFFKTNDLYELFTLSEAHFLLFFLRLLYNKLYIGDDKGDKNSGTETGSIFYGTAEEVNRGNYFDKTEKQLLIYIIFCQRHASLKKRKFTKEDSEDDESKEFVEEALSAKRIEELKKIARRISQSLVKNANKQSKTANDEKNTNLPNKTYDESNRSLSEISVAKKKLSRKRRKRLFEEQYEVPFLHKQTGYKEPTDEASEESVSKKQNDYVLGMLLKNSQVHSAFCHDQISAKSAPDEQLIEDEANVVAKRAADSIKRSKRKLDFTEPEGKRLRFGAKIASGFLNSISSKDKEIHPDRKLTFDGDALLKPSACDSLFAAIKKRKERFLEGESNGNRTEEYQSLNPSGTEPKKSRFDGLADEIHNFLAVRSGKATTFEILDNFKDKVPVQDTTVFRSLLRLLCTFHAETRTWELKDEFA